MIIMRGSMAVGMVLSTSTTERHRECKGDRQTEKQTDIGK